MKFTIKFYLIFLCVVLSACQSIQFVTTPNYSTEAALVANAYKNGLSAEINIPYQQAYNHLKSALLLLQKKNWYIAIIV